MPRPAMPPTPQPSTDIPGKSTAQPHLDSSFALPPAALARRRDSTSISSAPSNASDSSYRPLSPPSPANAASSKTTTSASRKRPSTSQTANNNDGDFSLPPPPTRSRKIIQMKPRPAAAPEPSKPATSPASGVAGAKTSSAVTEKGAASGKKKQAGGASTAAGRKIARKTAHSLIERRRRSKMNEEFGTLRDLVPACRGQEMHKLAILQASIEYMRYLEECVAELKNSRQDHQPVKKPTTPKFEAADNATETVADAAVDSDAYMSDTFSPQVASAPSTASATQARILPSAATSPAIQPSDASVYSTTSPTLHPHEQRHLSFASYASSNTSPVIFPSSSTDSRHYPYTHSHSHSHSHSSLPSPAISARGSSSIAPHTLHHTALPPPFAALPPPSRTISTTTAGGPAAGSDAGSVLASPTVGPLPQQQLPGGDDEHEDREATAALLMLGADRRSWGTAAMAAAKAAERGGGEGSSGRRSMSVRDLLG